MRRASIVVGTTTTAQFSGAGMVRMAQAPTGEIAVVFVDANSDVVWSKSVDGGLTWSLPTVVYAGTVGQLATSYDRDGGINGDRLHCAFTDANNADVFYRSIDIVSGALGTQATVLNGTSFNASVPTIDIARTRGGNLVCVGSIDEGAETFAKKSTDVGTTWTTIASPMEGATNDFVILAPGWSSDPQDAMCFFWDASANEVSVKYYDDSANTWTEASISTGMVEGVPTTIGYPHWSAAVDLTNRRNVLIAWNGVDALNADLRCWTVAGDHSAALITAKADVVTNSTDDQGMAALSIDQHGHWWAFYLGKADGSETFKTTVNVYCRKSPDQGSTWSPETKITDSARPLNWVGSVTRSRGAPPLAYDLDDYVLVVNVEAPDPCVSARWEEAVTAGTGKPLATYRHAGIVIDTAASPNPEGLEVEAWDEAGIVADILAFAVTDSGGRFAMESTGPDTDSFFGDASATACFKLYKNVAGQRTLLANTQGKQTWEIRGAEKRSRILVDTSTTPAQFPPQTFRVRGYVTHVTGGPYNGLTVTVSDVRPDGEVVLGTTTTNPRGYYQVTYSSSTIAPRPHADLKVSVTVITGEYFVTRCQAPPTCVLHLTVDGDMYVASEYVRLLGAFGTMLGTADPGALTDEKIEQLACRSGRSESEVRCYVRAVAITRADPTLADHIEALYGLQRQGIPDTHERLLRVPRDVLRDALASARVAGQISAAVHIPRALDAFAAAAVTLAKRAATGKATCSLAGLTDGLLNVAISDAAKRDAFLLRLSAHEGTIEQFWATGVQGAPLTTQDITDIELLLQLAAATRYHLPLVTRLWSTKGSWSNLRGLAAKDQAAWLTEIQASQSPKFPNGIASESDYAGVMHRTFESAMGTAAIAGRMTALSDQAYFYSQNTSFDFETHRVSAFIGSADLTNVVDKAQLQRDLEATGRLYRVTQRHSEIQALRTAGLDSARSIVRYGRARFLAKFGVPGQLSNTTVAGHVYDQAVRQASAALQLFSLLNPVINGPHTTFQTSLDGSSPPSNPLVADWTTLFGRPSDCACEDCRSMLSPAAHLTDDLGWLGRHDSTEAIPSGGGAKWTARQILIGGTVGAATIAGKRPDIGRLLLHCRNTFTALPYIDLVLELLEQRVSGTPLPDRIETTYSASELLATPEYLDPVAYDDAHLAGSYYPFRLPFSLWHRQARVFLEHLGTVRPELMESYSRPFRPTQIPDCKLWLRADLGLRVEGGKVVEWRDLSGFGHVAAQEVADIQPTVEEAGAGDRPAVRFSSGQRLRIAHTSALDVSAVATVAIVASHVTAADAHFVSKGAVTVSFDYGVARKSTGVPQANYGNALRDGTTVWPCGGATAATLVVELTHGSPSGGQTIFRVDGTAETQSSQNNQMVLGTQPLHIGAEATGAWPGSTFNRHLNGRIYEIVVFSRALTAAETLALEGYFNERYKTGAAVVTPTAIQTAQERLELTKLDRDIITGSPPTADLFELWGFDSEGTWTDDLEQASTLMARSGLSYDEVRELLDTRLLDSYADSVGSLPQAGKVHLAPPLGADPCDLEQLWVTNLRGKTSEPLSLAWDAIQRFLRLRLRLGWEIRDLDALLCALGGKLDAAFLERLADVRALSKRYPRLPLRELASWYAALDGQPSVDRPSFYASVFLDRGIAAPAAFAYPPTGADTLGAQRDYLLAATRLAPADYALLTNADALRTALRLPASYLRNELTLENVSRIHRYASFARAERLQLREVLTLQALSGEQPLADRESVAFAARAPNTSGELALPSWLTITCATTGRSIQTSPSTVRTGFGANKARARSLDGVSWGLAVEKASANKVSSQSLSTWGNSGSAAALNTATAPDGTSGTWLLTDGSASAVQDRTLSVSGLNAAAQHTLSAWTQVLDLLPATSKTRIALSGGPTFDVTAVEARWTRHAHTAANGTSGTLSIVPRQTAASHIGPTRVWGIQIEESSYPTSFIATTRAAETLAITSPKDVAPGGYFSVDLVVVPHYAATEPTVAEHNLLYFDANHRIFYRKSDTALVLRIAGQNLTLASLAFARNQRLTILARHLPTGRELTVSGAEAGDGTVTGAALAAISLPGTAYFFGTSSGAEESADLRSVSFFTDHPTAPSATRRYLSALDRLKEVGLGVDRVHYLLRHVSPAALASGYAETQARANLDALEAAIAAVVTDTTLTADADGEKLRALLTEAIATAAPERFGAAIVADVDTVMAIVRGKSPLPASEQRLALDRILSGLIADVGAIKSELVWRPQEQSGCHLWLEPSGIQFDAQNRVTGWANLAPTTVQVAVPVPKEISAGCVLWLRADSGVTAAAQGLTLAQASAFDNAAWTKTNVSVTANDTTDPDGGSNADRLTESTGTNVARHAEHAISSMGLVIGQTATFSVSAKRPATDGVDFLWIDAGSTERVYFNLATGTVATAQGGAQGTITALANGWYRCEATFVYTGVSAGFRIGLTRADATQSYTVSSGARHLWLYAADIAQAALRVSAWTDQSGGGHSLVQATEAKQPMLRPVDVDFGGQASIAFDGSDDSLVDAVAAVTSNTSQTWALMVRSDTADATSRWLLESEGTPTGGTNRLGLIWTSVTGGGKHAVIVTGGGGDFTSSVPDAATQHLIAVFDAGGGTARLFEAGVDRGTVTYVGRSLANSFAVGAIYNGGANYFDGRVAEVVVYDRIITAGERALLQGYFDARYAPGSEGPLYTPGGAFGLPGVRLDGVNDHLLVKGGHSQTSHTFFAVVSQRGGGDTSGMALLDAETGALVCAARANSATGKVGFFAGSSWVDDPATVLGDQILGWVLSSSDNRHAIYRDGNLLASGTSYTSDIQLGGVIGLGGRLGSSVDPFDGTLSAAGLFSRALNDTEVRQVHDYLLTLTGQPPASRVELLSKQLLDAKRRRDARQAIVQSLSSAYSLAADVTASLLERTLRAPSDPARPLLDQLLPATHAGTRLGTEQDRLQGVLRFAKAAELADQLGLSAELVEWAHGPYRDRGWLDLNDLPTTLDGFVSFDAATSPRVEGVYQLPALLTFQCNGQALGRTARIGLHSVRTGFGADAARAQSRDGSTWALLIEPARTNLINQQDLTQWTGTAVVAGDTSAAGTRQSCRLEDNSTSAAIGRDRSVSGFTTSAVHTMSGWIKGYGSYASSAQSRFGVLGYVGPSAATEWALYSASATPGSTSLTATCTPRDLQSGDLGAASYWGLQAELGAYPTSFMGADNVTFARQADRLAVSPKAFAGGFFRALLRFAPLYAHTEPTGDHNLLYVDVDNRVYFNKSTARIVLRIAGDEIVSSPLAFSRNQVLQIEVQHGPAGRTLSVSGATSGNGAAPPGDVRAAVPTSSSMYVFGDSAGAQEGVEVLHLTIESLVPGGDLADARRRFSRLLRLVDLVRLERRFAQRSVALADVFAETVGDAAPSASAFIEHLAERLGADSADVTQLASAVGGFGLAYPADYRSEAALLRLVTALDRARQIGATAAEVQTWLDVDAGATTQRIYADGILRAARAKYAPEAWPTIGRPLRNVLREAQRDALVDYLVATDDTIHTAEQLYDRLLVDPAMSSCALTSRIGLAISSVQLFVHRILLGGLGEPVFLDKDGREEWQWRKNYRVWEANRKVFLWPENWIEPDLRDDKTPLFKALEGQLRQGDVTEELAEAAYRDYLAGLDEIADLKVVGMTQEDQGPTAKHKKVDQLHVFAQTRGGTPRELYYRRWVDKSYWTPWELVPVDAASSNYLPIVEHGRLQLQWLSKSVVESTSEPKSDPVEQILLNASSHDGTRWSRPQSTALQGAYHPIKPWVLAHEQSLPVPASSRSLVIHDDESVTPMPVNGYAASVDECSGALSDLVPTTFYLTVDMPHFQDQRPRGSTLTEGGHYESSSNALKFKLNGVTPPLLTTTGGFVVHTQRTRWIESTVEQFVPIDTFFARVAGRNLFAAFSPFPSVTQTGAVLSLDDSSLVPDTSWAKPGKVLGRHAALVDSSMGASLGFDYASTAASDSIMVVDQQRMPGVRFQSFSHKLVCSLREALHRHGVDGLRDYFKLKVGVGDIALQERWVAYFSDLSPNTKHVRTPYPQDDFDFSYGGAYSIYNWEIFFHAPMLIATWLKRSRRFEEARAWLHAIFDPTDIDQATGAKDVWRFRPFRELPSAAALQADIAGSATTPLGKWLKKILGGAVTGDIDTSVEKQIAAWEDDPFNPHLLARMRPVAYQKKTVRLYVENLVDWGDDLFRRDTVESINEALQLYLVAQKILGPRPVELAELEVGAKTFLELEPELDGLGNALVPLESLIPSVPAAVGGKKPPDALPMLEVAYFCVPRNDNVIALWSLVEDRLFKIRHCMNIEGVVRELPLFQPPIDPALLVRARAVGLDLDSVLADLYAPPPLHRYPLLMQRAMDLTGYVTGLGQSLLAALEKKDGEDLAVLRQTHEVALLDLVLETRKRQVAEAEKSLESVQLSREVVIKRRDHYHLLFHERRISELESKALETARDAVELRKSAHQLQIVAQFLHMVPDLNLQGIASGTTWGLSFLASGLESIAGVYSLRATEKEQRASQETTTAGYDRRAEEWQNQLAVAEAELKQVDKQILAAKIRVEIANAELRSHERQLADSREIRDFLDEKYTSSELYGWMIGELSQTYHRAYRLAFDMARRAERAYQFERGEPDAHFIDFGHWDGLRKGLLAGERLMLDLRRMESSYIEKDRRFYEMTKHVSLADRFPLNLIELRETGSTTIHLREADFDLDYPGHYFRRIKSVAITLPAITGPHTSVNATLTLLASKIRKDSLTVSGYLEDPGNDARFLYNYTSIQSVCTSHGQNDSGVFQLDFRDERLLPFEGAGAISTWRIDLPQATNRFDLRTLTDAVIHIQYSAREGGGMLKQAALDAALATQSSKAYRFLSVRNELASAWNKFETELAAVTLDQVVTFSLAGKLPYVPGTGPLRMSTLWAAFDIVGAAPSTTVDATLAPAGTVAALEIHDASVPPLKVDYTSPVDVEASPTLTFTISQAFIAALPTALTETYAGGKRLKPAVFKDLLLILELVRDPLLPR